MISHDTRCALEAVVDLLNTAPEGDAPGAPDSLTGLAALEDFVRRHDVSDVGPSARATWQPYGPSGRGSHGSSRPRTTAARPNS